MRALPKNHAYNLFLIKETKDILEFQNNRTRSIITGLGLCAAVWGVYLAAILPLPDDFLMKTPLTYAFLMMGSICLLALLLFMGAYQSLILRKINRSIAYDFYTPGGRMTWKKRFDDFECLQMYTAVPDRPGKNSRKPPVWFFDLVTKDEKRIPVNPPGHRAIQAYNEEDALSFSKKISDFMGIRIEKIDLAKLAASPPPDEQT